MITIGIRARSIIVTKKKGRQVVDLSPRWTRLPRLLFQLVNDGRACVLPGAVVAWQLPPQPV